MKRKGFDIKFKKSSYNCIQRKLKFKYNQPYKIFIALKVLKFLLAYIFLKSKQKINKT